MIEKITHLLSESNINISDMINKSKGNVAYNIIDVDCEIKDDLVTKIKSIDGIIGVRVI